MSAALFLYRQLEQDLRAVRSARGVGTHDEDYLVEAMTKLWEKLAPDERDILDAEGPVTFPDPSR